MSVLTIARIAGDVATFQKALVNRGEEFEAIATRARSSGAMHHRFGVGEGFVLVVDEWSSAEQFEQFFGDPELHAFIGSVGGGADAPQITVAQAITSPDQF